MFAGATGGDWHAVRAVDVDGKGGHPLRLASRKGSLGAYPVGMMTRSGLLHSPVDGEGI